MVSVGVSHLVPASARRAADLTVWLYNNTGRSLFAVIVFHATFNVSFAVFPNYGSHWNPAVAGAITAIAALIVTFLWDRGR